MANFKYSISRDPINVEFPAFILTAVRALKKSNSKVDAIKFVRDYLSSRGDNLGLYECKLLIEFLWDDVYPEHEGRVCYHGSV